ncbi:Kinase [Hexamita inflata]|uniref:Kinase n=1 Tax=Hexamita inflata TaxID=28002 RepID=A0ABP1H9M6_9EUKA
MILLASIIKYQLNNIRVLYTTILPSCREHMVPNGGLRCLYELVALEPPYLKKTLAELIKQIQDTGVPKVPSQYSERLQKLIDNLLNFDANQRMGARDLLDMFRLELEAK